MVKPERFFSQVAAGYAASRPVYPAALAQWLASVAPERALAVDVGCGNGQLSQLLAEHFEQVVASDLSAEQLAQAGRRDNIRYVQAAAQERVLKADAQADLMTAAQAAHWFDLEAFYAAARWQLKPGGVLALIAYGRMQLHGEAGAVCDAFYDEVLADCWPPERAHVEAGYRTLAFAFDEMSSPPMQMTHDWDVEQLLAYMRSWSAMRVLEQRGQQDTFARFADRLQKVWGEGTKEVCWPLHLRVGRR